jgi:beta-lactamase regulating signal transducer with metallopeptidase domain/protocatechuate 3,4-dioxygenase beta subunit
MQFQWLSFSAGLFTLNVAIASIVLGSAALLSGLLASRAALPLRHSLQSVALILTFVSPLPIWIASYHGLGFVTIERDSSDDAAPMETESARAPIHQPVAFEQSRELLPHSAEDPSIAIREEKSSNNKPSPSIPRRPSANASSPPKSNLPLLGRLKLPSAEAIGQAGAALAVIWTAVALCLLLRFVRGLLIIRQLRRSLRPATDLRLIAVAHETLSAISKPHTSLYESPIAPAPLTLGWWWPAIVMPEGLAPLLDDQQLAGVLTHEAAHVARHDTAMALVQQLARIAFWWNPLVRAMNGQINQLRERICDDHAIKRTGDGVPLAEAIIKVAEWSTARHVRLPLAVTLLDDDDSMEGRITRLAQGGRAVSVKLNAWSAALIVLFAGLLAAVLFIPTVRAQLPVPPATRNESSQDGLQVRVLVVNAEGKPIANPRIGVQLSSEAEPVWQRGDDAGTFVAKLPNRAQKYCYLIARAKGYAPMRAFWGNSGNEVDDPLPAEFTFEMKKAITVGGIVVDENEQPVAGATVLFSAGDHDPSSDERAECSFSQEKFTTNRQGCWRCDFAPSTIRNAALNVTHSDYAVSVSNYSQDNRIQELRDFTHKWTLKKGFAVTGRVVDADGNPIAGAKLAIGDLNVYSHLGPFQESAEDGSYRFEKVAPKDGMDGQNPIRFTVSVLKPGFAPIMQAIPGYGKRPLDNSTNEERVVDFTLLPGAPLTLHVVDSQNRPVQGAVIIPDNWRDTTALRALRPFGIPEQTDADGIWVWADAPPGEAIGYDIVKSGYARVRLHVITVDKPAREETIVLKRPQIVTGTVIDARKKQPIPKFVVEQAFEEVASFEDGLYWTGALTRGKDGNYRREVTMPPHNGHYTYRAAAEGYNTAVSASTVFTEGETTVVDFELQPKEAAKPDEPTTSIDVRGRALNAAGEPIEGATIYLVSTNGIDRQLGETKSDAEGRYEFLDVKLPIKQPLPQLARAGTFQVYGEAAGMSVAWHGMRLYLPEKRPEYAPKELDESSYYQGEPIEMDLTFHPPAKLVGLITDENGKPVADAHVSLSALDYLNTEGHELQPNYREFWGLYLAPPRYREAHTDAAGRFEISGLPGDTVSYVILNHPRFATQTFFAAITDKKITEYRFISNVAISIANGRQVRIPQWETRKVRTGPLNIRLKSNARVVVQVIHNDDETPAKNISIGAISMDDENGASASQPPSRNKLPTRKRWFPCCRKLCQPCARSSCLSGSHKS